MFAINQVVKGKNAGTFIVVGHRVIGGEQYAQVKPVNPADYSQVGAGEMALPFDALRELD